MIILEQYLRMLSPELQVWVKEHDPKSAAEAATRAYVFVAARKNNQPWSNITWKDTRRPSPPQHYQRSPTGGGKPPVRKSQQTQSRAPNKTLTCYLCGH